MTASGLRTEIIALHGFLGLASDWDKLELGLPNPVLKENLWADVSDFSDWAASLNRKVRALRQKPVLLGYSMGGRLAMQAILQAPELYRAAIIVSAHPGLTTEKECLDRVSSDQKWADRFRSENWSDLMAAWMGQGVLRPARNIAKDAAIEMSRRESEFDREKLATAMETWSLGQQPNYRPLLEDLKLPTLFLSGAEDAKFTVLLSSLKPAPSQAFRVIEGAGHRVPWENPQGFAQAVREFLATVPEFC